MHEKPSVLNWQSGEEAHFQLLLNRDSAPPSNLDRQPR